ncbi:protein LemA [Waddlia chondrophila 2032/99]|uniref:Protein LemA n=2 Tax=Waddlia chondrophila TaxID=71667 RepID=F8LDP9_9BACT|nr:LemA family protein [Waddlia chondrophila]ADI38457.1 putative membrane protein [Waddlia chondrophila WSU 86-1044]CCB91539.1 protein LemA [Waddlia chondrophila 2032/99]
MTVLLVIVGVIALLALWAVGIYNNLIRLRNQVKNAWAQIDVQLQRRYDLIPNLIETVKGYMAHEKGTLEAVVNARNQASQARKNIGGVPQEGELKELAGAETALRGALANVFALSESYPDLKANSTMQNLQEELSSTENKVAFSRQSYNDQVLKYNTAQEQFPATLFAATFGHSPADLYEVEEPEARKAVKVAF